MITVKWKGIFNDGFRKQTITMDFHGDDIEDVHKQIREFVESKEDSRDEWVLTENEIVKITTT